MYSKYVEVCDMSKSVINTQLWFDSITSLREKKLLMDSVLLWLHHRKCLVDILIHYKYCIKRFEQKDFEIFLAGQVVLDCVSLYMVN